MTTAVEADWSCNEVLKAIQAKEEEEEERAESVVQMVYASFIDDVL